jgi:hypothetical protein
MNHLSPFQAASSIQRLPQTEFASANAIEDRSPQSSLIALAAMFGVIAEKLSGHFRFW